MLKKFLLPILAIFPKFALAANLFEPVPGDKSVELLAALFGGLGTFGASSSDAFQAVIATFNGAVLVIGGILVAYTILAGTIGTAHDGEMLGKKFSSVWIPIRTAMGTALILPVINGSYCVMQALVGWLIVQGVGLADNVWKSYMSADNINKTVMISLENPKNEEMAWTVFKSLVCMRGYEKIYNEGPDALKGGTVFGITNKTLLDGSKKISFGATTERNGFKKDSCGSVVIAKSQNFMTPHGVAGSSGGGLTTLLGDLSTLNDAIQSGDQKHGEALNSLISSLDSAASGFITSGNISAVPTAVKNAAATYATSTKDAAAPIIAKLANFDELEKSSTKDGWVLAGAWYMRMSYLMDVAHKNIVKTPEASAPQNVSGIDRLWSDAFIAQYSNQLNELAEANNGKTGVSNSVNQSDSADGGGIWDYIKSGFNIDTYLKKVFVVSTTWVLDDNDHPVMAMKGVGNWVLGIASAVFTGYIGLMMMLNSATPLTGFAGTLATALLPVLMMLFPMLMTSGIVLSYVLPMMPFVIWIGVVLGWVILCVEAIIAAPIWAVMHLSPHGDDMVGTGSQGYRLVLSLMLRPVLMIFGLIAALTIITIFGAFINKIFADVFILSQQDSNLLIMILGVAIAPLIYMGLMWTLITKTMSIIHVIPDQLLQWFGGGGAQLGDYGQTIGGHGSSTFVAAGAGGLAGLASRGIDVKAKSDDMKKQIEQVQEARNARIDGAKKDMNDTLGAGGGDIISQAILNNKKGTKESGQLTPEDLTSLEATKMQSQMSNVVSALGGPNSIEGMEFNESMQADVNSGMSFSDALHKNAPASLDEAYGKGVGNYVSAASNGSFTGSGFARAMGTVANLQKHYSELPSNEQHQKISGVMERGMKMYERSTSSEVNGGDNNANYFVDKVANHAMENSVSVPPVENSNATNKKIDGGEH